MRTTAGINVRSWHEADPLDGRCLSQLLTLSGHVGRYGYAVAYGLGDLSTPVSTAWLHRFADAFDSSPVVVCLG